MKYHKFVILLLASVSAFAQDRYEPFVRAFAGNYDQQNFEAIYDLTSDTFRNQITREQLVTVLADAFRIAGRLKEIKVNQTNNDGRTFHAVGERGTFAMTVSLDAGGKAAALLIRPVENQQSDTDPQSLIDKWKSDKGSAGLVIGRIVDGKHDIQYLGVADKRTSAPIDAASIFEIGSISKPLTGILLHTMIAEGRISLVDPVNKFLPEGAHLPKVNDEDILIRHLVTHSSCLPRMPGNFNPPENQAANPYEHYSEKMLLAYLPHSTRTDCVLGMSPVYSNLGAGLLGYVLTKLSGMTYPELIKERIAQPLKTESLGVIGTSDHWVQGHTNAGTPQGQWTFNDALAGGGSVDASAGDMLKLLLFLMKPDNSSLGKAVVASTTVQLDGPQRYGTFWIRQPKGTQTVIWHNGQTGGFNAFIAWIEGTQTGVFILSNNGDDIATRLGIAIMGQQD